MQISFESQSMRKLSDWNLRVQVQVVKLNGNYGTVPRHPGIIKVAIKI